jgi:hypothetical protein
MQGRTFHRVKCQRTFRKVICSVLGSFFMRGYTAHPNSFFAWQAVPESAPKALLDKIELS